MTDRFIKDICKILNIEIPSISYDISHFSSNTMIAQCDSTGTTIFLQKKNSVQKPDYFFTIAHELRHICQIRTDYDWFFSNYQTINEIGIEKYNNQFAEIDANAFASIIMIDFFHLQPLYEGLSQRTVSRIKSRLECIINQLTE